MNALAETELPSEAVRTADRAWSLITAIGAEGRAFRLSEVEARVATGGAKAKGIIRRTIRELLAAGNLMRCDGSREIASRNATYRLTDSDPPKSLLPPVSAFVNAGIHVQIPRTHDGLWALFRWLDKHNGGFTATQVSRLVGDEIAAEDVHGYIRALVKGGFLSRQETRHDPILRVARRQAETPLVRADGALAVEARRRDVMWRTMKMSVGGFTAAQLAHAATTRTIEVSVPVATAYCEALHAAGYLRLSGDRYRFRATVTPGSQPPHVLRARFVWDPNECRVVGPAVIEGRRT